MMIVFMKIARLGSTILHRLGTALAHRPAVLSSLRGRALLVLALTLMDSSSPAQLFQSLQSLTQSIPVGSGQTDPATGKRLDGPRWVCTGDFDLDGNQDFATCH